MRLDPEPEKAQVLDLRAKLQAARETKHAKVGERESSRTTRRVTRALARSLNIEEDEDDEDWEESYSFSNVSLL